MQRSHPHWRSWLWSWLLVLVFLLPGCGTVPEKPGIPLTPPTEESKPKENVAPKAIPSYGGPRRVVISKSDQMLRAYDGDRVVFESRVSTGKEGKRTPAGSFRAQYKERMHYSTLYENAPMPYSVQFSGNYFIHGYSSVPNRPASHGCIRLPLSADGQNPARQFYQWVRPGTSIRVTGQWGK